MLANFKPGERIAYMTDKLDKFVQPFNLLMESLEENIKQLSPV